MKKARRHVPGSKTLMPFIIEILQQNGGTLKYMQIVYMIMFKFDLPEKYLKKAKNEVGFSGTYLRKVGALVEGTKKGVWTLTSDYLNMSFEDAKRTSYAKYDERLGR